VDGVELSRMWMIARPLAVIRPSGTRRSPKGVRGVREWEFPLQATFSMTGQHEPINFRLIATRQELCIQHALAACHFVRTFLFLAHAESLCRVTASLRAARRRESRRASLTLKSFGALVCFRPFSEWSGALASDDRNSHDSRWGEYEMVGWGWERGVGMWARWIYAS
jgi:hypothetical protein